jgi:RNA polymerase sigma-70 factor (ECF subfamily)
MDVDFHKSVRAARMKFLDEIEPHRGDLYRYCRSLAGSAWDAEDLAQETLLRAFGKLAEAHWRLHLLS